MAGFGFRFERTFFDFQTLLRRAVRAGFAAVCVSGGTAGAAGFQTVTTETGIQAGIWYPTGSPVPEAPNTPFRQALAWDAELLGTDLPLVVISHGDGGWMGGHAHTALALAQAGFVAVALEHPGNNSEDESATPTEWMVSRPRDISQVLDFVLKDWQNAHAINPDRIGIYGFSAGGYTALVAGGAKPDISQVDRHCADLPDEFVCASGFLDGLDAKSVASGLVGLKDERITAISVAAPGFGFLFTDDALDAVSVPVQVWSGERDDRVPHATNGAVIANSLGSAAEDVEVVEGAGHFAFMATCNPRLQEINPRIWAMVCVDAAGFDRAAFHKTLNRDIVAFFDATLPQ